MNTPTVKWTWFCAGGRLGIESDSGLTIATLPMHAPLSDARLLAAAPEMLGALIDRYLSANPCPNCGTVELLGGGLARCKCADQPWTWEQATPIPEWESSRAAIAKATGGGK